MNLQADISVQQGDFQLDLHIDIADGEVLAILGPNGAGKTTLLRSLAGLIGVDSGSIAIAGQIVDDPTRRIFVSAEKRNVGVVFQDYLLFDHLDTIDNIAFGLRAQGIKRAEALRQAKILLERFDILELAPKYPRSLSGGQAQRVALARALAVDPYLLLLDEPLSALDIATRQTIRQDLHRHLQNFSGAVILVTHDPMDAYTLADHLCIIENGQESQSGTVSEITSRPCSRYVSDLVGANLITGTATGNILITSNGSQVVLADPAEGAVLAIIRPRALTITKTPDSTSSARNSWPCVVSEINRLGDRARVCLHGNVPLIAEITNSAIESLNLVLGDHVYAIVKATEIDVHPL